jgi:hypothetical protein
MMLPPVLSQTALSKMCTFSMQEKIRSDAHQKAFKYLEKRLFLWYDLS